jgi:hypothetical protein
LFLFSKRFSAPSRSHFQQILDSFPEWLGLYLSRTLTQTVIWVQIFLFCKKEISQNEEKKVTDKINGLL